jgi:hypothetical protein
MPRVALRLEYLTHIWFPCVDVTTHLRRPYRSLIVADSQQISKGSVKRSAGLKRSRSVAYPDNSLDRICHKRSKRIHHPLYQPKKYIHVYINILNEFQPSVCCNSYTPGAAESATERDFEAYVKESRFESGLPAETNPRKFHCTCCVRLTKVLLGHACAGC